MTAPARRGSLFSDGLVVMLAGLFGLATMRPIHDNSALTHLATGMSMVARSWAPAIPRLDHYTFSAPNHPWVVQSWLPSYGVGVVERVFGLRGVLLLSGVAACAIAVLVALLARTGRPKVTAAIVAVAVLIGAPSWSPRPLMVGLICFALTALVLRRRANEWWLVVVAWIWVQSHGSFPLGVLFLALVAMGAWLDNKRDWRAVRYELRALGALGIGVAAGAINPLGPRLVFFPLNAIDKRAVFSHIAEWRHIDPGTFSGLCALVGIALTLLAMRRAVPRWRVVLPLLVFVLLACSAQRNITVLGLVVAFALGEANSFDATASARVRTPVVACAVVAAAALVFTAGQSAPLDVDRYYPVGAVSWAKDHGRFDAPQRVLTRDFVGNYLELRDGPRREVFIDDRFDMFPVAVSNDYFTLLKAGAHTARILDRWHISTVIWNRDDKLVTQLLTLGWTEAYSERRNGDWVVLLRPSA